MEDNFDVETEADSQNLDSAFLFEDYAGNCRGTLITNIIEVLFQHNPEKLILAKKDISTYELEKEYMNENNEGFLLLSDVSKESFWQPSDLCDCDGQCTAEDIIQHYILDDLFKEASDVLFIHCDLKQTLEKVQTELTTDREMNYEFLQKAEASLITNCYNLMVNLGIPINLVWTEPVVMKRLISRTLAQTLQETGVSEICKDPTNKQLLLKITSEVYDINLKMIMLICEDNVPVYKTFGRILAQELAISRILLDLEH